MKISKTKLRQIIKEEFFSLKETLWDDRYDDVERMRPRRQPRNPEHVKQDEERREKDREHKAWLQRRKDRGLDEAEETALNSPREAGRQWSYENIVNTVGDLVREALEGHGLDADSIRDAVAEALDEELGPVQDEGPRITSTGPWAPEYRDK